jgi:hypothetical protein
MGTLGNISSASLFDGEHDLADVKSLNVVNEQVSDDGKNIGHKTSHDGRCMTG